MPAGMQAELLWNGRGYEMWYNAGLFPASRAAVGGYTRLPERSGTRAWAG